MNPVLFFFLIRVDQRHLLPVSYHPLRSDEKVQGLARRSGH